MSDHPTQTCVHGHDSPAGSRFCNTCGQPLACQAGLNVNLPERGDGSAMELAKVSPSVVNAYIQPPPTERTGHVVAASNSTHCSGCGHQFQPGQYVCENCQTIKPLAYDHYVDPSLFQWALDGQAMAKLRAIKPLVAVANQVSKQVGRPWIEANFNGIRLSSRQMPNVYAMAVQAARILGLRRMPSVYVSGARPWDAMTFGSNDDAFIVMGSALVSCFQKSDLMFLFAREMGHIVAGHALWKTVIQFCVGEHNAGSSMMRNGIAGLLDPFKLLESAVELPLIAWARQAEITADRAGLLASGGLEQARRTLMMWSLRSPMLYRQINIKAWLEQQEEDTNNNNVRLAEAVTSSTPYLTRRLKLMQDYEASPQTRQFRLKIMSAYKAQQAEGQARAELDATAETPQSPDHRGESATHPTSPETDAVSPQEPKSLRIECPACHKPVFIPTEQLTDKSAVAVKCPNADCQKVSRLALSKPTDSPPNSSDRDSTPEFNEALSQMG